MQDTGCKMQDGCPRPFVLSLSKYKRSAVKIKSTLTLLYERRELIIKDEIAAVTESVPSQ